MLHDHRAFDPARAGYRAIYRTDQANHCPGCGRSHWIVGRASAECAFCATAVPLDLSRSLGVGLFHSTAAHRGKPAAWAA